MGTDRDREGRGIFLVIIGVLAVVGGIALLVLPVLGLLAQVILLGVGMIIMGLAKVLGGLRTRHVVWYIRGFGIFVGVLFLGLGTVALLFPSLGLDLVALMIIVGFLIYGFERIGIGVDSTLPPGERSFAAAIGAASVALAVIFLLVEGLIASLILIVLAATVIALGLTFILSGIYERRLPEFSPPGFAEVASGGPGAPLDHPLEARLHCFVVASRAELVASLGRLVHKGTPKLQQGALKAARQANLNEEDLFQRLRAYATQYGDLMPRETPEWGAIQEAFETYRKRSAFPKFQWVRPVGSLTSKARISRVAYALRQTPLDLRATRRQGLAAVGVGAVAGALGGLAATFREATRVPKELMKRIETEFGLLQGGLRSYGAYILHIVGAPADADSDNLGDLFRDEVPLLWDLGASHTEVGALDPADHLLSATTNFLLGPAILFQHFFSEGLPVALLRKGDRVRVQWARDRFVMHSADALDVEKGFKRGDVTLPSPLVRRSGEDPPLPPGALEPWCLDEAGSEEGSERGEETGARGLTGQDLRQAGVERLDWNTVYMMMEGEFGPPSPTPAEAA